MHAALLLAIDTMECDLEHLVWLLLQGLDVDLGKVMESLLDEEKIELTNEGHKAKKRVHALSSFMAVQSIWIDDSPLEWLKLAGRSEEEMEFMTSADVILSVRESQQPTASACASTEFAPHSNQGCSG